MQDTGPCIRLSLGRMFLRIQACVCMSTDFFFLTYSWAITNKIPMNGVLMRVCTWLEMKTGKKLLLDIT